MGKMKKLGAAFLSLALTAALAVPAFAADGKYDITIANGVPGDYYAVHQIFTGTPAGEDTLNGIAWSGRIDADKLETLLNALDTDALIGDDFTAGMTADEVAEVLSGYGDNSDELHAFVDVVINEAKVGAMNGVNIGEDGTATIGNLAPGYYVLVPTGTGVVEDLDNATVIVVTEDETVTAKGDAPTVEKKVQDTNDTTGDVTGWQDSADYDIGDEVPFQLTVTIPKNANFEYYLLHDDLSDGLTLNANSIKVMVDGQELTLGAGVFEGDYYVYTDGLGHEGVAHDCDFEILIWDAAQYAGSEIIVTYTATLNENAVMGSAGNPNDVYLGYSNDSSDWTETPEDTVIVFTYQTIINKVDGESNPLAGAAFTLEKLVDGEWVKVETIGPAEDLTQFVFKGLDDGTYRLTETTVPDGYNAIDPIEFTVVAQHDENAVQPTLISLTGNAATGEIEFTPSIPNGSLSADVVNLSGVVLPETGGMGTTLFYVIGGVLVVGVGILLIAKKRTNRD